jgi:hypothetical protein
LTKLDGDSRGGAALSVKEVCIWIPLYIYIFFFFFALFYSSLKFMQGWVFVTVRLQQMLA